MITPNQHNIRQLTQHRWLWSVLLIIWLLTISASIVHTQQHAVNNDNPCQLCLSHFNHTPFIGSTPINLSVNIQHAFIIKLPILLIEKQPPANFYNRGPPKYYYY